MDTGLCLGKAVFLDFDGVLFDTVKEAYVICLLAARRISAAKEAGFWSRHFKQFEKNRHLIGPAWNYFYLLKAIDETEDSAGIEKKYTGYLSAANETEYGAFEKAFFAARERLKKTDEGAWLALNTPYRFLAEIYSLILKFPRNFFIVTTKDRASVLKLMQKNNMHFSAGNVYDKDSFKEFSQKGNIIRKIMGDMKINSAIFVDDSAAHIKGCGSVPGLAVLQPNWGYISPDKKALSEQEIISAISGLLGGA